MKGVILAIIFFSLVGIYHFLSKPIELKNDISYEVEADPLDDITFSNTQTWNVEPYPYPEVASPIAFSQIKLDPPPQNSSKTTEAELILLHSYKTHRTKAKLAEIESELNFETTEFGTSTLGDIFQSKPLTKASFEYMIQMTDPAVMEAKKFFDRVRPSYLDTDLKTAIPVPAHPAYPSAHAVNAHLIKFMLSELNPDLSEQYEDEAERIATNREIAGVHYSSDSEAGQEMAEQLYAILSKDNRFLELLTQAKNEW